MKFLIFTTFVICANLTSATPSTSTYPSTGIVEPHNVKSNETNTKLEEPPTNLEVKESGIEFNDVLDISDEEPPQKTNSDPGNKLNSRCQQLYNFLVSNRFDKLPNFERNVEEPRPIYVTSPKPTLRPTYPSTARPSSFYITAPSVNHHRQSIPVTAPIKYIRLEPVILQKTILSNGRTVYYWHKSLPTAVEYPQRYREDVAKEESYQNGGYDGSYSPYYNYYYSPNVYPWTNGGFYHPGNQNQVGEKIKQETTTEQSTSTTTTTEEAGGFGFGSIFPFYGSSANLETTTTSTEPPTTTSTMKTSELLYQHPLRFVVPVPYDEGGLTRSPWGYQPYPYYPKTPLPYFGNYRLPYNPNYQYGRTIAESRMEEKVEDRE